MTDKNKSRMIIGFIGKKGSGKTASADFLVENMDFSKVKLADTLKDMCRAMGLTEEMIEGELKEEPLDMLQGKTPREIMQTLGTEWGRNIIGENLWVDLTKNKIKGMQGNIVMDDIRFENEAQLVRDLGGILVKVNREDSETSTGKFTEHASEKEMEDIKFNASILNDRELEDLYSILPFVIKHYDELKEQQQG